MSISYGPSSGDAEHANTSLTSNLSEHLIMVTDRWGAGNTLTK